MSAKTAMAAKFTEVTLEDMDRFLKRGFRALRPKASKERGEVYYDLHLSSNVVIRVWTSIGASSGAGADVGADAIRVQLYGKGSNRPLKKGKAPIVKRTQGWKDNLQDRIEDEIESYEDKESYWESRATGERPAEVREEAPLTPSSISDPSPTDTTVNNSPDAPTDKQIRYVQVLLRGLTHNDWVSQRMNLRFKMDSVPGERELRGMSKKMVSLLIDVLKDSGYGRRF